MFYQYFYPIKGILSSWTSISIDLLSLVRFLSTNYIRIRCHSIISHFTMNHKCRYCGLSFKQNPHRLRHERNSHADDQPVRCVICEQIFQETTDLHQHVDNAHPDGTLSCSTCFKTFSVKRHFQVHQDPFHHNQDQVDSFDAVDVHRASNTGVNSTFTECAIISRRERVWNYRIHLGKTIVLRGANLTIQISKTPTNPMLPSF